ncbi:MAG TPA: DUF4139 domain-containing protein [Chitinophagales bacterium]|nr:DUF4139 domain-containing protein [Chitinophagales bacterium]
MARLFFAAIACLCLTNAFAQENLKATDINIFKNGTYFVVKEGDVGIKNNKWAFASPATPLLGTIWFTTTKDVAIRRIDYANDTIKTSRQARNWFDIAKTAKGKKVRIVYSTLSKEETKEVRGTLLDIFPETSTLKLKAEDGGLLFLFTNSILEFHVEGTTEDRFKADSIGRVASVFFSKENGNTPLKLSYMSTGMMWHPSYNIKIIDDKTLQLELKALVENYSEDIQNANLTLTVGAPQFRYGMQIDPAALAHYAGYAAPVNTAYNNYQYRNYATDAVAAAPQAYNRLEEVEYQDYSQYTTTGEKSDDVYRYRLGKVAMPKGTKSSFNVFSANVPYDDIYECTVHDYIAFYSNRYIPNNPEHRFDVFHSLKLNNNTTFPFTTAPVFVLDEKLEPLAQDIVNYTPAGGKTKVQLSRAPDVYVTNTEDEKNKVGAAKTIHKVSYSLVTISGSIPVENLQPKAITLNLTKHINGRITEASDGGDIKKPGKYAGPNPQTHVEWNIKLGANEKKTVTYQYEVYVANY